MVEIVKNGEVVQRSKNLRGIIERGGKIGVRSVSYFRQKDGTGWLGVEYLDNSSVHTTFADFMVLCAWVANRRMFKGARHITHHIAQGNGTPRPDPS